MKRETWRKTFMPDGGALLEIRILKVNPSDWEALLDYLSVHYHVSYEEDGIARPLPKYDMIIEACAASAVGLRVRLSGFTVNCHFFDLDEIEMDLLPEDIDSSSRADSVFNLMSALARLLRKRVILCHENSVRDPKELLELAICSADPKTGEIS